MMRRAAMAEQPVDSSNLLGQQAAVQDFVTQEETRGQIIESYTETPDSRRAIRWPQLVRAVEACQHTGATLLIAELSTLTNNEPFTQILIQSQVKFYCCDQPFVTPTVLEALCKHAKVLRNLHGKLIREGLKLTSAKSGNPNAAEVISKVNKPKIDTAIVFAFLLHPIIQDYREKGYSQRQMVKSLNEEGFTAPEGGRWVLSQLQKVLDRVRLNEVTLDNHALLSSCEAQNYDNAHIVDELNAKKAPSLKRQTWDEPQVQKLLERRKQIKEIVSINRFVTSLLPLITYFRQKGLSEADLLDACEQSGLQVRDSVPLSLTETA
jgi:hypothetical protein